MSSADKEKDKESKSASSNADKKASGDLGLLEEDDEFEEFPAEGTQCFIVSLDQS